jgi:lipopolysaccharide export system protein LptA
MPLINRRNLDNGDFGLIRYILGSLSVGLIAALLIAAAGPVAAQEGPAAKKPKQAPKQVEVTADQSLEWYQDQRLYVARGNAKAVRGETVVEADVLTAHQREEPKTPPGTPKAPKTKSNASGGTANSGDIDKMTAEGHVRITDPRQRVTGEHAVYDLDQHVAVVTGNNLRYETEKEIVTAKDQLEYWEDKKIAVARGNAVADGKGRHVEGDTLTAEFRDTPSGEQQMWKMTAEGHVTVVTATDITRGDRGVYDVSRDIAVVNGNVRITRNDGTQLAGDVGEVDFKTNHSRLLNNGHTRVRALLVSHDKPATTKTAAAKPPTTQPAPLQPAGPAQ